MFVGVLWLSPLIYNGCKIYIINIPFTFIWCTFQHTPSWYSHKTILPYKRKQLVKMTFLKNEQNVSVMYNAISLYLDLKLYLLAGWVFLLQTRNGSRRCSVQSKNNTFSDLGDLSVAPFCQSRAVYGTINIPHTCKYNVDLYLIKHKIIRKYCTCMWTCLLSLWIQIKLFVYL